MEFLRRRSWAILLFLLLAPFCAQASDTIKLGEQQIKAGLLYNFLKYTKWPDASAGSFKVCVYGDDPFNGALQPMRGRTVNQRVIELSNIHEVSSVTNCHLLFVSAKDKTAWSEIRDFVSGKPILTVGDFNGFTAAGGMIEFGYKDDRIAATLDIATTNASGLRVEDRMLKLVTIVGSEKP